MPTLHGADVTGLDANNNECSLRGVIAGTLRPQYGDDTTQQFSGTFSLNKVCSQRETGTPTAILCEWYLNVPQRTRHTLA